MTNSSNPHSQFELFPKDNESAQPSSGRIRTQIKDLTLSIENIIVVCIVLVMTFVLFFSFGVERGKRLKGGSITKENPREEPQEPFVREKTETIEVNIDTEDLASETEEITEEQEVIQIPIERDLKDEHLFTIQVASFKRELNARKEADSLAHMGTDIFVVPKGSYSIVCVGKFSQHNDAKLFSKRLKSKYKDLLVRRL